MKATPLYYLDAGIVNGVGHNLETVEFLKNNLGKDVDFTVIAGKRFADNAAGVNILPLLRYGSPHWSMPSRAMRWMRTVLRRWPFAFLERLAQALKAYELRRDLSVILFKQFGDVLINSMELDDALMQCEALWALEPSLRIKIILHYSPFVSYSVSLRPKLIKPIDRIRKLTSGKDRLSFFADTTKLCQVYAALLEKPVTLLPIPHAKRGENSVRRDTSPPYRVVYFGTYSEAKTPHLIPEIIRLMPSSVPLVWSINITYIAKNPVIDAFENEMRMLEAKIGKPLYHVGPFDTAYIEDMFAQSDIFLIPYHSHDYEIQSSGVVMEALVSGKVPLISRSMADAEMLAAIDPHLVFRPNNELDMTSNLEYIAAHYEDIKDKLRPLRQEMEQFHNPKSFMKILVG